MTEHHAGRDADPVDMSDIRDEDAAARERERQLWDAAQDPDVEPADEDHPPADLGASQCRWCREAFESAVGEADHVCPDRRESDSWQCEDDVPMVDPQTHELETKLLFDGHGQSPYWALVSEFDRCFASTRTDESGSTVATDDEIGTFEAAGSTWQLNHDEAKVKYWQGSIAAEGQDFDAYYEYNVGLVADDAVHRRRINFQFRISHPDMRHARSGDPIKSVPDDLPDGIRVQTDSANVEFDEVLAVLQAFADELTINPAYFERDALHRWSRVTNCALYVRLQRDVSEEKIVAVESGLLDRLFDFARRQRGRWEYHGDNREIMGHRTHLAACQRTRNVFYPATVGTMLKSYHMKHPSGEPEKPTDHPKLECQYSSEFSDARSIPLDASLGVDYDDLPLPTGYDFQTLRAELDEWLLNCLHWAGLPVRAAESVYVADEYWDATESVRSRTVRQSPLGAARDREESVAEFHVLRADATPGQRAVLKALADGDEGRSVEDLAEDAGVSTRTVYRAAEAFEHVLSVFDGSIQFADEIMRETVADMLGRLEDTAEWLSGALDRLVDPDERVPEDSVFARWLRRYGVEYDTEEAHLEITVGQYDLVEIRKLLRAGLSAARQTGPWLADDVLRCSVSWYDADGNRRSAVNPFAFQGQSSIAVLGAHIARLG